MLFCAVTILLLIVPFSVLGDPEETANVIVTISTKFGNIIGEETKGIDEKPIYKFTGIPYAKTPERFKDPEPWIEPYKDGFWRARNTKRCIQLLPHLWGAIPGTEDCLHLNIYTPTLDDSANYDVVVFIHGGGFIYGAGHSQSPDYLFLYNKEVVFVAINYRLGPFGFLSTDDAVVPGNMGLKDQVMALQWIKENIKNFGGNPNKVTLSGMSAGGISVHLHYLSPMSRDLFSRGISMSGVALSNLIKTSDVRKGAEDLAKSMGCPTKDSVQMVECLRGKEAKKILEVIRKADIPWKKYNSYYPFGPVVDRQSPSPFLEEHPFHILRKGKIKNAPWLVSATTSEGLKPAGFFIDNENMVTELNDNWSDIAPYLLMYKHSAPNHLLSKISEDIKQHYLQGHPIAKYNRYQAIKLIGDRLYMTGIENAVRLHAHAVEAPVYMYMFGYRGKYSFSSFFSKKDTDLGVSHIDDLIYILNMNGYNPMENDAEMVKRMVGIWTSFMKDDVPVAKPNMNSPWPRVERNIVVKGKLDYVVISSLLDLRKASTVDLSERNFWERLPLNEIHVVGDRRVPTYIKKLEKKQSKVRRFVIQPVQNIKSKISRSVSKITG